MQETNTTRSATGAPELLARYRKEFADRLFGSAAVQRVTYSELAERLGGEAAGWNKYRVARRLSGQSPIALEEWVAIAAALDLDLRDLIPPPRAAEREAS